MKQTFYILAIVFAVFCLLFGPLIFAAFGNELPDGVNASPQEVKAQIQSIEFNWLTELGMPGLTAVLVFAIGYFVRRLKNVPNFWLAALLPLGTIFYFVVGDPASDIESKNVALKMAYGLIISIASVLAVIIAHDKIMSWAATRFPMLAIFVSDDAVKPKPTP